ncbi:unnamed protein product [Brassica rapa subsp. trilocularis]
MSQGISGNAQPTIFNREAIRDQRGEVVREIEFVTHSVDPAEADAHWVALCNVEEPPPEPWNRTQLRVRAAVDTHRSRFSSSIDDDMGVFFEDTSLPAVYATGQSSGRRPPDAEDDAEPTVEDPIFGGVGR